MTSTSTTSILTAAHSFTVADKIKTQATQKDSDLLWRPSISLKLKAFLHSKAVKSLTKFDQGQTDVRIKLQACIKLHKYGGKKRGLATFWWENLSNQRGLLCRSDYIKHRAGKALIKVNKEPPKAPAALSSTLWPESNLLTAEICCTKNTSQLRNKVTTAFTALLGVWFLTRLLGEKTQTNRNLAVLTAEKPALPSPVSEL